MQAGKARAGIGCLQLTSAGHVVQLGLARDSQNNNRCNVPFEMVSPRACGTRTPCCAQMGALQRRQELGDVLVRNRLGGLRHDKLIVRRWGTLLVVCAPLYNNIALIEPTVQSDR